MRKGICIHLCAVVFCLGLLATVASAQDDADPAARFRPFWESVKVAAAVYNADEVPDAEVGNERQLVVEGAVEILDEAGLIGIDRDLRDLVVLGPDGAEVYVEEARSFDTRWYYPTEKVKRFVGFNERADEFVFSHTVPLEADQAYPASLSRVEWTRCILVADSTFTIDMPFEADETWVELVPGLEIMVEEATAEEGSYDYSIEFIYDPALTRYNSGGALFFRGDDVMPPNMMIDMALLNADGVSMPPEGESSSHNDRVKGSSNDEGMIVGTASGHGACDSCGTVATIRFTFAVDAAQQDVRLVLEDVPVPGF